MYNSQKEELKRFAIILAVATVARQLIGDKDRNTSLSSLSTRNMK
ncbi:hypothetical protein [Exiguobacterium artemiae]